MTHPFSHTSKYQLFSASKLRKMLWLGNQLQQEIIKYNNGAT